MQENSYKVIATIEDITGFKFKEKKDKQYAILEIMKKHTFVFFPKLNVLINKFNKKTIILED